MGRVDTRFPVDLLVQFVSRKVLKSEELDQIFCKQIQHTGDTDSLDVCIVSKI